MRWTHLRFRTLRDKVVASVLGLAQLGASVVALGGLGCGRTAGNAAHRGSSGATPASPSASSPADSQSLGPVDPAAYAKACGATCKAHEPPSATTPPCYNVSVTECASQCQAGLVDLDAPCAECLVKEMTWPAAQGGCSETECVCSGGTPVFGGAPCSLACTSTRERQAKERAASPEPDSLGHQPLTTIDLGKRFVQALSASDRNGLWSVMTTPAKELVLAELSLEGSVLDESALPPELHSGFRVYASSHGVLVFGKNDVGAALARFDLSGAFVWSRAFDGEVSPVDAAIEFGGNAELGSAIFALRRGHDFAYIDADGAELETRPVPALQIAPYPSWALFAVDSRGGLFIGESGMNTPDSGRVRHLGPGWPGNTAADVDLAFDGNAGGGAISDVRADAAGGAYVLGWRRSRRATEAGGSLEYGAPFAGHVNAQGGLDYTFGNENVIPDWGLAQLGWNDDGSLYLLTVEDPVEYAYAEGFDTTGLCSVWGCSAFVLRKLRPSGSELWRYEHRKHSAASALSVSTTGVVVIAGAELRDEPTAYWSVFSAQ